MIVDSPKEGKDAIEESFNERGQFRSISQRPPNIIELFLSKDQFSSNEEAQGYVMLTIAEPIEAKKITLSILGELTSQVAPGLVKKESAFKKLKSSISGVGGPTVQRTFTAAKDPAHEKGLDNKRVNKTLTRTFTIMSRMTMGHGKFQNSKSIVPETKNRELFCHYNIPLFTFKTPMLPIGIYKVPFRFNFSTSMLPTAEYNSNDKNFQFAVIYRIIAELEENKEEDDQFEEKFTPSYPLKSMKEIKIFKGNNINHNNKQKTMVASSHALITEVSGKLRIPTMLCFSKNDVEVQLKLESTSFTLGQSVKYQLESINKPLKQGKTKIFVNIVEELITFGNKQDATKIPLKNHNMQFVTNPEDESKKGSGSLIKGEVTLPNTLKVTFRSTSVDIEHFFEVILSYATGVNKQGISLRIPITIKKTIEEEDARRPGSAMRKHDENESEENVMVLPRAKFKLDEKFNLLTKTAEIFNDIF